MPRTVIFVIGTAAIIAVILLGIRLVGNGNSTAVESDQPDNAGQWVESGVSLGIGRISEWRSASDEDRLAACGHAIMAFLSDDRNVNWDRLKEMAVKLESRISERVADGKLDGAYFVGIAGKELLSMGVLRKSGDEFIIDLDK